MGHKWPLLKAPSVFWGRDHLAEMVQTVQSKRYLMPLAVHSIRVNFWRPVALINGAQAPGLSQASDDWSQVDTPTSKRKRYFTSTKLGVAPAEGELTNDYTKVIEDTSGFKS